MEAGAVPAPEVVEEGLEREALGATLDRIEAGLAEVDAAMARLDDASYGACVTCGSPLRDDVLAAAPTVRSCPDHR
ncbi:MAG: hypothetical protein M3535_07450 [Actinomycetota bacterium]|jgi:RNA polymerase-binding transcription factor DksA|nr:hypothetical protein [Actinomycetota bacterium]MDQ3353133.1 hypothetical protein [Actinomycetota bacterium]